MNFKTKLLSFVDEVSNYSKKCVKEGIVDNKKGTKDIVIKDVNKSITNLIIKWKNIQEAKLSSLQNDSGECILCQVIIWS